MYTAAVWQDWCCWGYCAAHLVRCPLVTGMLYTTLDDSPPYFSSSYQYISFLLFIFFIFLIAVRSNVLDHSWNLLSGFEWFHIAAAVISTQVQLSGMKDVIHNVFRSADFNAAMSFDYYLYLVRIIIAEMLSHTKHTNGFHKYNRYCSRPWEKNRIKYSYTTEWRGFKRTNN